MQLDWRRMRWIWIYSACRTWYLYFNHKSEKLLYQSIENCNFIREYAFLLIFFRPIHQNFSDFLHFSFVLKRHIWEYNFLWTFFCRTSTVKIPRSGCSLSFILWSDRPFADPFRRSNRLFNLIEWRRVVSNWVIFIIYPIVTSRKSTIV